ncbi:trichohyalin-like [Phlebotomus papatasi]|uniref:trichohyalin-like n=1 Tax=Phlebotomus papatasi TaxID=29031 RepID=UPI002483415D|nr:trichohyalin-like [Phlebotomus papatasi]
MPKKRFKLPTGRRAELERSTSPPRRFESSLGSDDTSTRESECSHEHSLTSPISPVPGGVPRATLFDSLAAELRAKLNGNAPPLLLPPRDYDTVHRSKGNLAATELRRCQNQLIVGGPGKQGISSHGSSGIRSDLAASLERQDEHSSSDDDWTNDHQESVIVMQAPRRPAPVDLTPTRLPNQRPTATYLYPHVPLRNEKFIDDHRELVRHRRIRSKVPAEDRQRKDSSQSREEEEIKPILMKNRPPYNEATRFRELFEEGRRYAEEPRRFQSFDDDEDEIESLMKKHSLAEMKEIDFREKSSRGENLTDKQKYMVEKYRQNRYRERMYPDQIEDVVEKMEKGKYHDEKPRHKMPLSEKSSCGSREKSAEISKYGEFPVEGGIDANPYNEPESQPYWESVQKMLKSSLIQYKFEDAKYHREMLDKEEAWQNKKRYSSQERYREGARKYQNAEEEFKPRRREHVIEELKVSPKERFYSAKEKFQAMERGAHKPLRRSRDAIVHRRGSIDPPSSNSLRRQRSHPITSREDWSSDEDLSLQGISSPSVSTYRDLPYDDHEPPRMTPSKSLGNIVKGYRKSYAEPRDPLPRGSGRVGLAAVNPY